MTDKPIDLDERRGVAEQKSTEDRRRLNGVRADQAALKSRYEDLERRLLAAPSNTWPEVAAKARYLIELFAGTFEAEDPRRKELIARALEDLARLSEHAKDQP